MSAKRLNPRDPAWWTEERRQALRDMWTMEKRVEEALKRKDQPQGNRDPKWWTPERRAEASLKALRRHRPNDLSVVEDAFDAADRLRERWRNRPW